MQEDRSGHTVGPDPIDQVIARQLVHPSRLCDLSVGDKSAETLRRRLVKLAADGVIRECGNLKSDRGGRPEKVFSTWDVPAHLIRHEVGLTVWFRRLGLIDAPILRGPKVDQQLRPDATVLGHPPFHVEWDTGEMTRGQVEERMGVWRDTDEFVLFVTGSKQRLDGLRPCFRGLEDVLFVTWLGNKEAEDLLGTRKTLEYLLGNARKTTSLSSPKTAENTSVTSNPQKPND